MTKFLQEVRTTNEASWVVPRLTQTNPDGGGRHLKFRKRSITLDWIKTSALNFIGKMHHGHAEMTT